MEEIIPITPITDQQFDNLKTIALTHDIHTIVAELSRFRKEQITEEQISILNEILSARKFHNVIKMGLNVFEVNGTQVIALNKKNAERKVSGVRVKRKRVPYSNKYVKIAKTI